MKNSILLIIAMSLICNLIAITGFQQTVFAEKESEEWSQAEYEEEKAKNLKQEYSKEDIDKVVEQLKNGDIPRSDDEDEDEDKEDEESESDNLEEEESEEDEDEE